MVKTFFIIVALVGPLFVLLMYAIHALDKDNKQDCLNAGFKYIGHARDFGAICMDDTGKMYALKYLKKGR